MEDFRKRYFSTPNVEVDLKFLTFDPIFFYYLPLNIFIKNIMSIKNMLNETIICHRTRYEINKPAIATKFRWRTNFSNLQKRQRNIAKFYILSIQSTHLSNFNVKYCTFVQF